MVSRPTAASLARPFVLDNWPEDDLDYLGGPFAEGLKDRRVAAKEWLELSAAMPNLHQPASKPWTDVPAGYRSPAALPLDQRVVLLYDVVVPDEGTPVGSRGEFNNRVGRTHLRHKLRKPLHSGKREAAGKVTMPHETWHISSYWKDDRSLSDGLLGRQVLDAERWSQARVECAVCGAGLPAARRKYCSGPCDRTGSNAVRRGRRRTSRVWPVDEHSWYIQPPQPQRLRLLTVHRYDDHEATVWRTVSRDYRLRRPWAGEPKVWKITQAA